MTDLGALVGNDTPISSALAINSHGAIDGVSIVIGVNGYAGKATLWSGGTITDLNAYLPASLVAAGWRLYAATGINDSGQIIGNAHNFSTNQDAAFGATVVPTPSIACVYVDRERDEFRERRYGRVEWYVVGDDLCVGDKAHGDSLRRRPRRSRVGGGDGR